MALSTFIVDTVAQYVAVVLPLQLAIMAGLLCCEALKTLLRAGKQTRFPHYFLRELSKVLPLLPGPLSRASSDAVKNFAGSRTVPETFDDHSECIDRLAQHFLSDEERSFALAGEAKCPALEIRRGMVLQKALQAGLLSDAVSQLCTRETWSAQDHHVSPECYDGGHSERRLNDVPSSKHLTITKRTRSDLISLLPSKVSRDAASTYPPSVGLTDTWYNTAKFIFFVGSGIVFLRMAFYFIGMVVGVGGAVINSLRPRRQHPVWFRFWDNVTCCGAHIVLMSLGVWLRHHGSETASNYNTANTNRAKLIVSNHFNILEAYAIGACFGCCSAVARKENQNVAFLGRLARAFDFVEVDRSCSTSRRESQVEIHRRTKDPLSLPVVLFPEGTCSSHALFQYNRGAFASAVPTQIACFKFESTFFNAGWTGRPAGGNDMYDWLVGLACQFTTSLDAVFLPVYHPTDAERQDPALYARHVQLVTAAVIGEAVSDATVADYFKRY